MKTVFRRETNFIQIEFAIDYRTVSLITDNLRMNLRDLFRLHYVNLHLLAKQG